MFAPKSKEVVAPVTTPVFGDPGTSNISDYCAEFKATDQNTIATVGSIICVLAEVANDKADSPLRSNCRNAFIGESYTKFMDLITAPGAAPKSDNEHAILAIRANMPAVPNWLVNLISAAKKKPLTDENVGGFFAMLGHTGTKASAVARLVNQIAVFFPDKISDSAFRALLADGIWTTYRNTRASTGGILKKMLPDFRALGITSLNDADEGYIIASADAPWDLNLSVLILDKYKAYGAIFLQAAGTPIDKWYQGNKAVEGLPAARVRAIKDVFLKYLEVKNKIDGVSTITTVDGFNSPEVKAFFA
jgi:hypothetical protein